MIYYQDEVYPKQVNECSNLVTNFGLKEVDGRKFLILTKQVFLGICP